MLYRAVSPDESVWSSFEASDAPVGTSCSEHPDVPAVLLQIATPAMLASGTPFVLTGFCSECVDFIGADVVPL